jgi:hypothetical protein
MAALLALPLVVGSVLILAIPVALWVSFVATYLWEWFIVPVFHAPSLGVLQMWGIFLFIGLVFPSLTPSAESGKDNDDGWKAAALLVKAIVGPLVALVTGYVLRFFLMPV